MSLTQLQIFSKLRDATAALRGYEYQHLKTLETWLRNRISNTDEVIYCDHEEDIFQRNIDAGTAKFRQIKLYSTDFSFSSEAIQETLANFFMLYAKGEYMFTDTQFVFETNASVVGRDTRGNDAALLSEWKENQDNLSADLLGRIRQRVKAILSDYIEREYAAGEKASRPGPHLEKAYKLFHELTDDVFDRFILSIKWQFDGMDADGAMRQQVSVIESLIQALPLPYEVSIDVIFAILHREVVRCSIEVNPEDRVLTNRQLDILALRAIDEGSGWYSQVFEDWSEAGKVVDFRSGELYEIIKATRYYRTKLHKSGHYSVWMPLLGQFIDNKDVKTSNRRKATYEFLMAILNPEAQSADDVPSMEGYEEKIRFYFKEWQHRQRLQDIQEDITLLQIIRAQVLMKKVNVSEEEVEKWAGDIMNFIDRSLGEELHADDRCAFLELRGDFELQVRGNITKKEVESAISWYRQILPFLDKVQMYSLLGINDQLQGTMQVLIRFNHDHKLVEIIDSFLAEIQEAAEKTGRRHDVAKLATKRGKDYLDADGVSNYLRALHQFHKAKELWKLETTKEGYILALLNISQIYYSLGMNLAGKYYALCAWWVTWQLKDESMYHRLIHSSALVFTGDFKQGAWINAIYDFEAYLHNKEKYSSEGWAGLNEMFMKIVSDVGFIFYSLNKMLPALSVYLDYKINQWGKLKEELLLPVINNLNTGIKDDRDMIRVARKHVWNEPLSDIGKVREIQFNASGVDWVITFDNTYTANAVGEEFVSLLQIYLCDIARIKPDFFTAHGSVKIQVLEGVQMDLQKADNGNKWKVTIPKFESKQSDDKVMHYVQLSAILGDILSPLSILQGGEFDNFWQQILHVQEKQGAKALDANTYQKVYYDSIGEVALKESQADSFEPPPPRTIFPVLPKLLQEE